LALYAHLPGILRAGLALAGDVVVEADRFACDESALEVAVDRTGRLRRLGAAHDRPGMRLLRTDGEEREQSQQVVAGADDAIEAAVVQTEPFQEFDAIGLRQLRHLRLDRR